MTESAGFRVHCEAILKLRLTSVRGLDGIEQRPSTWIVGGIVLSLALLATALSGGFAAAKPKPLPALEAGKGVDTGQWHLVVHGATLSATRPDGRPAPKGQASLAIEAELTNRTRESSSDIASALRVNLPAIAPKTLPLLLLARDRSIVGALHPKMAERLYLVWDVPVGTAMPDPLPVVVMSKIHKTRDNLVGGSGWFDPKPLAEVRLRVATPDTAERAP
ncbi:MAG TPA: hypothetical protein VLF18_07965 [Tahibacter sp.]|uniref:hypothetical protein n=1 Tax=Tahibacter sp. TaxID=2056211 RepID=UPI002CE22428|nr:hypothetical protein [Tahibacter sp.]HSX60117.1 hypothetical protein [Tahibacter sp.]